MRILDSSSSLQRSISLLRGDVHSCVPRLDHEENNVVENLMCWCGHASHQHDHCIHRVCAAIREHEVLSCRGDHKVRESDSSCWPRNCLMVVRRVHSWRQVVEVLLHCSLPSSSSSSRSHGGSLVGAPQDREEVEVGSSHKRSINSIPCLRSEGCRLSDCLVLLHALRSSCSSLACRG